MGIINEMVELNFLGVVAAVVLLIGTVWYIWRTRRMSLLSRCGIPGPIPNLITGNLKDYIKKGYIECHKEWIDTYGRICGYYIGAQPYVLVADTDLLRKILIKDFSNFTARPVAVPGNFNPDPRLDLMLTRRDKQKWARIRRLISSAFSISKLKQMSDAVNDSADITLNTLSKMADKGEAFDIFKVVQALIADVFQRACYGVRTGFQENLEHDLIKSMQKIFKDSISIRLGILSGCLPELRPVIHRIRLIMETFSQWTGTSTVHKLLHYSEKIVEERRMDPKKRRPDLMQALLDSQIEKEEMDGINKEWNENGLIHDNNNNEELNKNLKNVVSNTQNGPRSLETLTEEEVIVNCFMFIIAGFETSTAGVGIAVHLLVTHPDIQEKVRNEVTKLVEEEGKLDYNVLTRLPYFDQVWNEALRWHPPVTPFVTRSVNEDYTYGDIRIPKGAIIQIPVYYLSQDPKFWEEPEKFNPDRWSPENKKSIDVMAFQAFGQGPRNCPGLRFAHLEAKLALAKILYNFKLLPCESTEMGKLSLETKFASQTPARGIIAKVVRCR